MHHKRPRLSRSMVLLAAASALATSLVLARPAAAATTGQGGFVPVTPFRLVDTRQAAGVPYGTPRLSAGETRTFNVYQAGNAGVPAGDVGSVALNLTAVSPAAAGFLTVWPAGTTRPTTSVGNYRAGVVIPNAVTVQVGSAGSFSLYTLASVDIVIDVMGYYSKAPAGPDPGCFQGIVPFRLMDTRSGLGAAFRLKADDFTTVKVTGTSAAPSTAVAVVLNVTAVNPAGPGFLTLWPNGQGQPGVSNVNYVSGDVRPNQVTVGVGAGGYIKVYSWAAADVIVDIMGYYAGGSAVPGGFVPIAPQRIMDTRINLGNMYYDPTTDSVVLAIAGTAGMPAAAAIRGFSLNVTADQTDRPGYVTVYPDGRSRPVSSNLNFETSQTVANAVSVGVGTEGGIEIYTPAFPEVIVDLEGYFKA